jgi:hypothetical protein
VGVNIMKLTLTNKRDEIGVGSHESGEELT